MKKRTQNEDRLHSVKSAAQFLGGVSESTVRVWLWQGRFQKIKIGRLVRIRQSELMKMIHPVSQFNTAGTVPRKPVLSAFRPLEEMTMIDAIDELVARSKNHRELRTFHKFHKKHPEVLDFLVQEIQLRIDHGFEAFSYHSLWEYCRWKLELEKGPSVTFLMNDHAAPFYARAITILHPEFNGRAEFRKSKANAVFGTRIEPVPDKRPKNYARRLQWADGTAIENGWRPSTPHVVNHAANRKPDIHGKGE